MLIYKKLYFKLFNSISDAIQQIKSRNYGKAEDILKKAQIDSEELYISEADKKR